eukprot:SAG31_NODE_3156_length_4610_cov_12.728663_5_plen_230_part_00
MGGGTSKAAARQAEEERQAEEKKMVASYAEIVSNAGYVKPQAKAALAKLRAKKNKQDKDAGERLRIAALQADTEFQDVSKAISDLILRNDDSQAAEIQRLWKERHSIDQKRSSIAKQAKKAKVVHFAGSQQVQVIQPNSRGRGTGRSRGRGRGRSRGRGRGSQATQPAAQKPAARGRGRGRGGGRGRGRQQGRNKRPLNNQPSGQGSAAKATNPRNSQQNQSNKRRRRK